MQLDALPECPVSAIHPAVRSVTAWASIIGAAAGAKVIAFVASAYTVGPGGLAVGVGLCGGPSTLGLDATVDAGLRPGHTLSWP